MSTKARQGIRLCFHLTEKVGKSGITTVCPVTFVSIRRLSLKNESKYNRVFHMQISGRVFSRLAGKSYHFHTERKKEGFSLLH